MRLSNSISCSRKRLAAQLDWEIGRRRQKTIVKKDYSRDPAGYARDVLKMEPWSTQVKIMEALCHPPYMITAPSANNQGKTCCAAMIVNWFYDSFPENSGAITTAPSAEHITNVLWGEVRTQRARAGLAGFETRAAAPLLQTSPTHYAKGIATDRGERLKGRHLEYMLFIIDEAVGVKAWVYD